jgi:hypothetical protein
MQKLIKKTVKKILDQLEGKNWRYPIYQLVLSVNDGLYFGRYNADGTFENLIEQEPADIIGYPVTVVLIDSSGETIRVIIEETGYKFSDN